MKTRSFLIRTVLVSLAALISEVPVPAAVPAGSSGAMIGLKDAFAGRFLIGTAGDLRGYSEAELANIRTHYNIITPENSMKPQPTHPSEATYNFATPDALVKWAQENNIKVWGHTLVWHAQTGRWFFEPGKDGQPVTRELAMERLKSHIMTVAGRYKGKVLGWDVVNEAIADGGDGRTENLRRGSWYSTIGPDVLTLAFKWAHEADPGAQLYYNDYNIEQGAVKNTGKHASSMLLLKRLIAEGAPIHGVGIQGHWHLDTDLADVEKAIENYASLGLRVAITELDVTAFGRNSGAFPTGADADTMTADAFQRQAQKYAELFRIFKKHEKSIDRVTFWGISDRRSWRSRQRPLLFDAELKPKPALQAILDVAKEGGQ
ncbi:MAG TPA: endo-1,4-beta-xylanase [Verrucomicrobia bacterium]|nr:endo-1,4-beta-xylanase [Verrucomicrobiota bacterium]HOP97904.1 endo-1,4-beta-xylanase [Verrucomicrobiota bacterium]